MVKATTANIDVTVDTVYIEEQSNPLNNDYVFAYRVRISNQGKHTIKLLRRHWIIFDGNGHVREVEGEGVVGEQPVLLPQEMYQYTSGTNMKSDWGKMHGTYTMLDLNTNKTFKIEIPVFELIAPFKFN